MGIGLAEPLQTFKCLLNHCLIGQIYKKKWPNQKGATLPVTPFFGIGLAEPFQTFKYLLNYAYSSPILARISLLTPVDE